MKKISLIFSVIVFLSIVSVANSFAEDFVYDLVKYEKTLKGNIESLRMQLANGIAYNEIICRNLLYLAYKSSDGSPACVDELHVGKLVKRGWATLGETSLLITTDKKEYHLGEKITITMKNNGDTKLLVNCKPDFSINDENGKYIDLPLENITPPCNALFPFEPLSKTTLVWGQLNYKGEQVKPGIYTVHSQYKKPFVDESGILAYEEKTHTINFTITEQTLTESSGNS